MDIYSQNIIDHYKNPRNQGRLKDGNVAHNEVNYSCGDKLTVDLKVEQDKVADFKFNGGGCAISQATMSILSEDVTGKEVSAVLELNFSDIKKMLGVPISERRMKCALLGLLTVQNAILKNKKQPLREWSSIVSEY